MGLKAGGPLFAVRDMNASLAFYREVLGLEIVNDFGANVVLTGGLSLQTLDTWASVLDQAPDSETEHRNPTDDNGHPCRIKWQKIQMKSRAAEFPDHVGD